MKKEFTKKSMFLMAVVLSAALFAAGCTGQKEEESPDTPSAPAADAQDSPAAAAPDKGSQDALPPSQEPADTGTEAKGESGDKQDEPSEYDHPDLEGDVLNIQDDRFEISEIFVDVSDDGESSIAVSEPENSDNTITVMVTDQTQYQVRKINSDRMTSTMAPGTKEDVKKGSKIDLWGTSDQGTFYADTVVVWVMPD
ncbi:hypothetical protein [Diplocloster hominis]|uniref:hypothetical protein n=1 Tax=Diplocloster hominis TaxID=3079010 RepID=UPI0031BB4DDF